MQVDDVSAGSLNSCRVAIYEIGGEGVGYPGVICIAQFNRGDKSVGWNGVAIEHQRRPNGWRAGKVIHLKEARRGREIETFDFA